MSTAESEFAEASRCATEVEYLRELLLDFGISVQKVPIMEDNTACVQISKTRFITREPSMWLNTTCTCVICVWR